MGEKKKAKPKPKPKKEKVKPKPKKEKKNNLITVIKQRPENTVDTNYDKKINILLKKLKSENQITDNTIRFGWK